jgi:hypothetical protein
MAGAKTTDDNLQQTSDELLAADPVKPTEAEYQ